MNEAPVDQVFQPSRSGDHEICSRAQALDLRILRESAHDLGRGRKSAPAQPVVLRHDLHGQFARGDQHQRGHAVALLRQQSLHDGQQKGQRLAGAGLGRGQNVFSLERRRNRRRLHRGGVDEFLRRKPLLQVCADRQFAKHCH